ncbi:hypothetical protein MOK15_13080 [Sphingobium sp. BYY-5]|uniref:hypothetical protein n=1 Tax=Sphingobium sp. BYY-5 TaxID=2926400 RepID=UPI001FA73093|nr:hypothetical protein [Sphingobium sp. BYY-5]MCI4591020.1 hypothetical protein [Sphingobium sp. BYY-5]
MKILPFKGEEYQGGSTFGLKQKPWLHFQRHAGLDPASRATKGGTCDSGCRIKPVLSLPKGPA